MAKTAKKKKPAAPEELVWTRIGELEAAYSGSTDRVFLRQALRPLSWRVLAAEMGAERVTSYVAATAVYGLDREALKALSRLLPPKKDKR